MSAGKKKKSSSMVTMRVTPTTVIIILVLVIALSWTLITVNRKYQEKLAQRDQLSQEADDLQSENDEMQYAVDNKDDPEVLEDIARDELDMVQPGEEVFTAD